MGLSPGFSVVFFGSGSALPGFCLALVFPGFLTKISDA